MTGSAVLALAEALVVAVGCASLADLCLGLRSRSLFEWNQSFLAGLGIVSAVTIGLSPFGWPWLRLGLLIALLIAVLIRRPTVEMRAPRRAEAPGVTLAAAGVGLFVWSNAHTAYGWDGFQIWMTKAEIFFHTGSLALAVPTPGYMGRIAGYPPAVPVAEAVLASFHRSFPFAEVKAVFPIFALSALVGTFRLVEILTDARTAAAATGLTAFLPGLMMGSALGGYADLPLASVAVAAAGGLLETKRRGALSWRDRTPWLLGTLPMVKAEGIILLAIGVGIFTAAGLRTRRPRLRHVVPFLAPVAVFLGACVLQGRLAPGRNVEFAPVTSLRVHTVLERGPRIVSGIGHWLLHFPSWGVLWPAFAVAGVVLGLRAPRSPETALAAAVAVTVSAEGAMFFLTRWGDYRLHLDQAYPRLISQVSPIAVAVIAAALFGFRSPVPDSGSDRRP
ncbi:MAG TPA: hypothetical protein VFL12_00445 [Thermoanaerobaculia bacterium]|nr:hypothetical protein [Thermoanaerobaculia bacterium]